MPLCNMTTRPSIGCNGDAGATAMISLKRILLPTDFSENSVHAQKYACALVEQFDAELHLLHVFQDLAGIISDPVFGTPIGECIQQDSRETAEERLRTMLDPKWSEERHVVCATAQGTPFLEIIRYAKRNDIDMIVATTHGRSGLSRVLLGSTAEKIVRKTPCPVMVVRSTGHQFVVP